jgi:hypothetical protein
MTTLYGLSTQTVSVPNAGALTTTGGGSSTTPSPGTQTLNYSGYLQIVSLGGVTPDSGGLNPPNGHGWLLDDTTTFAGTTTPSGSWVWKGTLATSDVNAQGSLTVRFYRLNIAGATYTLIATAAQSTLTLTPAGVALTLTAAGVAATTFAAGESLYVDLIWDQTGGGSGSTLTSVRVASTSAGVPGAFEIDTPTNTLTGSLLFSGGGSDLALAGRGLGTLHLAGGGALALAGQAQARLLFSGSGPLSLSAALTLLGAFSFTGGGHALVILPPGALQPGVLHLGDAALALLRLTDAPLTLLTLGDFYGE